MRGTLCLTFTNLNVMTSKICSTIPLDILTIFSTSITLNLRNIFLIYIQLNFSWIKQMLQIKKLLSYIQILKLLAVTFIPTFMTNAMASDFLLLISHGWVVTFQDSNHTVFTFRSWLDLLDFVQAFCISILKISKLYQNCWQRVTYITSFKNIWKAF